MKIKKEHIGIAIVLVIAVLYFHPGFLALIDTGCLQQQANVATACGGIAGGSYSGTATLAYDGNWETSSGNGEDFTVTYMKPSGALSTSVWLIRDGTSAYDGSLTPPSRLALSIPSDCWDKYADKLVFHAVDGGDSVTWSCDNGAWKTLRTEPYGGAIYEEAMVWDGTLTGGGTSCTNTCPGQSQMPYPDCSCYTPTGGGGTNEVTGPVSVEAGTINTYNAVLSEPYPGSYNPTEGVLTTRYCGMALVDSGNNVVSDTGFTACTASYTGSWSVLIPNVQANFVVLAVMTETKQHYDGGWVIDYTDKTIQTAALGITSKVTQQPIPVTAPADFGSVIQGLLNMIAGIFAQLQQWLNSLFGLGVVIFLS